MSLLLPSVAVAQMPSAETRLLRENPDYRIRLLKAPLVTISSTEIRKGLAAGRDMSRWLM